MSLRNFTGRLLVSGGVAPFNPFEVPAAWDGYIADTGITVAAGFAVAAEDQTGNGNTLATAGAAPAFVAGWRNGRAALLGRVSPSVVALQRATFDNGPLVQPITRYIVGSWSTTLGSVSVAGLPTFPRTYRAGGGMGLPRIQASGTSLTAATKPTDGTAYIERNVFNSNDSSIRIEPHGQPVISAVGPAGTLGADGVSWLSWNASGTNWVGHGAFLLEVAADLPLTDPTLDNQIMQWLRGYYDIVHV